MKTAKEIVMNYMQEVWVNRRVEAVDRYVSSQTFIQHNPNHDNGREALKQFLPYLFGTIMPQGTWEVKRVIAENDLVVVHSLAVAAAGHRGTAVVDIFRVADNQIVEHWDLSHEVPDTTKSGNPIV